MYVEEIKKLQIAPLVIIENWRLAAVQSGQYGTGPPSSGNTLSPLQISWPLTKKTVV